MNGRQKRAIGLAVSGLLSITVAAVLWLTTETPDAVNTALIVIGMVLEALGLKVALPNTED